ncbi:protein lin-9 homolog [Coccinella septempunctata]|uniref:protein lin-9 homolog n=1 Tax=Coccinella septempunctata TaxID=41139 RepID=UPI001D07AB99|nr:protein lin-9 homolog [Coccinella septempunctata]XP_044748727.1 protein lin-9 homolog [Coccinella septempunctata]XP_044748729.1 protein lin-9 homolog [Coccinella septempunctata]XP_044748730.1 protein lin-9 homolog [Coccinella septempunctata]XP_044748731.1 protein lin-9 homolog [Coccinella septempunctata]
MNDHIKVKEEILDDDDSNNDNFDEEEMEEPILGPAALGLQRVGTVNPPKAVVTTPKQVLNARGMPARIRKKNKLFYDDELVNTPHHRVPSAKKQKTSSTPKKIKTPTPSKQYKESPKYTPKKIKEKFVSSAPLPTLQSPDRKIGQKIGLRLRNLLKLPKAHKWVCYEWFYSDIDNCLFSGENDFSICLKESFPELQTRFLTRVEWTKIRRMMGKPRRCSQAFFNEERLELEKKRKKIRALQQRKATDLASFKDLPSEIPMQLVIGTKVTARLRKPQDGLFTGSIDAVDTSNNTYRITFERQGLGTYSVPDYEVLSNEPPETLSLSSFHNKFRPRNGFSSPFSSITKTPTYMNLKNRKDPLLSGAMLDKPIMSQNDTKIGGFPVKLLEKMVLVTKILKTKKSKVSALNVLNSKAEKQKSYDQEISEDFQKEYASVLTDLEKLNHDLQIYLDEIQSYCHEIAPEPSVAAMLVPSHLREKCREDAMELVQRHNSSSDKAMANEQIYDLITDLTALMLQVKSLADSDQNAYELQVLQGTMEQIKRKLSRKSQEVFENHVEIYMKHIQMGLGQVKLKSEMSSPTPLRTY